VDPKASWALKLKRAQKHLEDFTAATQQYTATHGYAVRKEIEGQGKRARVVHRLHIDQPPVEMMLPLMLGDFLFNTRSALDHIVVASVRPRKHRKNAAFPIFVDDIFERDANGKYLERHADARKAWNIMTRGLADDARTIVTNAQPFNATQPDPLGIGAKNQIFAILSILQNADKHRELVVVGGYVDVHASFITGADGIRRQFDTIPPPPGQERHILEHRAEFGFDGVIRQVDPATVDVEVEGPIEVLVGRSTERGPMYRLVTLTDILERTRLRIEGLESVLPA
jgi:hypothetical protein